MKPDFYTMNITELRAYLLAHRNHDEAFDQLADRLELTSNETDLYPIPDTPESIAIMETAIQGQIQKLAEKRKS